MSAKGTVPNTLKKLCPNCRVARLWPGPSLGAPGKIYCLECGTTYRSKTSTKEK